MASPSPLPPYFRVVELSACVNASNSVAWTSGAIPMPVSRTPTRSSTSPPGAAAAVTVTVTLPRSVNLTAFERKLRSTCRNRVTSPATIGGTDVSRRYARSTPVSLARVATRSSASSTASRTENGWRSRATPPASIFEKSRTSLMIARSASPETRTVST